MSQSTAQSMAHPLLDDDTPNQVLRALTAMFLRSRVAITSALGTRDGQYFVLKEVSTVKSNLTLWCRTAGPGP